MVDIPDQNGRMDILKVLLIVFFINKAKQDHLERWAVNVKSGCINSYVAVKCYSTTFVVSASITYKTDCGFNGLWQAGRWCQNLATANETWYKSIVYKCSSKLRKECTVPVGRLPNEQCGDPEDVINALAMNFICANKYRVRHMCSNFSTTTSKGIIHSSGYPGTTTGFPGTHFCLCDLILQRKTLQLSLSVIEMFLEQGQRFTIKFPDSPSRPAIEFNTTYMTNHHIVTTSSRLQMAYYNRGGQDGGRFAVAFSVSSHNADIHQTCKLVPLHVTMDKNKTTTAETTGSTAQHMWTTVDLSSTQQLQVLRSTHAISKDVTTMNVSMISGSTLSPSPPLATASKLPGKEQTMTPTTSSTVHKKTSTMENEPNISIDGEVGITNASFETTTQPEDLVTVKGSSQTGNTLVILETYGSAVAISEDEMKEHKGETKPINTPKITIKPHKNNQVNPTDNYQTQTDQNWVEINIIIGSFGGMLGLALCIIAVLLYIIRRRKTQQSHRPSQVVHTDHQETFHQCCNTDGDVYEQILDENVYSRQDKPYKNPSSPVTHIRLSSTLSREPLVPNIADISKNLEQLHPPEDEDEHSNIYFEVDHVRESDFSCQPTAVYSIAHGGELFNHVPDNLCDSEGNGRCALPHVDYVIDAQLEAIRNRDDGKFQNHHGTIKQNDLLAKHGEESDTEMADNELYNTLC